LVRQRYNVKAAAERLLGLYHKTIQTFSVELPSEQYQHRLRAILGELAQANLAEAKRAWELEEYIASLIDHSKRLEAETQASQQYLAEYSQSKEEEIRNLLASNQTIQSEFENLVNYVRKVEFEHAQASKYSRKLESRLEELRARPPEPPPRRGFGLLSLPNVPIPRLSRRLKPSPLPSRVMAITLAKSGTHLLYKILNTLGFRLVYEVPYAYHQGVQLSGGQLTPALALDYSKLVEALLNAGAGDYLQGHLPYTKEHARLLHGLGYQKLVLVRDPRDVAVSFVFHVLNTDHPLKPYFQKLHDFEAQLMTSICGVTPQQTEQEDLFLRPIAERLAVIRRWSEEPNTLELCFEDLIGEKGGGSKTRQLETLRKIEKFLELTLPPQKLAEVAEQAFDPAAITFREGQSGGWKNYFSPQHIEAFEAATLTQDQTKK